MRRVSIALLVLAPVGVLLVWIARNTYWADATLPMPPKGEARTNPFYAAQRFAEALGARTAWDRVLDLPPPDSVIVLSTWHWSLTASRRNALERWVEAGGRLVVDRTLIESEDEFARWCGIVRRPEGVRREADETRGLEAEACEVSAEDRCRPFQEERDGRPRSVPDVSVYRVCGVDESSSLMSTRPAAWALREGSRIQAVRVRVGRGSVTMMNAALFRHHSLFAGDHARLFVAATQLDRNDDVHFLSEDNHPSLLALTWQHGAPVVAVSLAVIGLVLWRGAVRLGPLAAAPAAARRSLAEQIRGTGQFALRYGRGKSLHAASVRALDEAAARRVKSYTSLATGERTAALARLTGFDRESLAAAIYHPALHRSHELRRTIELLESARRQILAHQRRSSHGTR